MARPLRLQADNTYYHVMTRGQNRRSVFLDDRDKLQFLDFVAETCRINDCHIAAYCLMDNHIHLAVHTRFANLSTAIKMLLGCYVQRFNFTHKTDGPLFKGRFKSSLVNDQSYLETLVPYIHRNPVKAGICSHEASFEWSSFKLYQRFFEGDRTPAWFRPAIGFESKTLFRMRHESAPLELSELAAVKATTQLPTFCSEDPSLSQKIQQRGRNRVAQMSDLGIHRRQAIIDDFVADLLAGERYTVRIWAQRNLLGWDPQIIAEKYGYESSEPIRRALVKVSRSSRLKKLRDKLAARVNEGGGHNEYGARSGDLET